MKLLKVLIFALAISGVLCACGAAPEDKLEAISVTLSDEQIKVDGVVASTDASAAVFTAKDIVYYEAGKDFTYGEGSEKDAHGPEQAAEHTVVHITKPGAYRISGKLSKGQIAVDLGEDAKKDPNAVVTLILDGADITCQVAPAIIFYNVYECADTENPTKDVDTTKAGANILLAKGTANTANGAYVAKIYKPDSVVLNSDQTAVEDAKKLHKYDGAVYSKMSMNIDGSGKLNINAENEGLDSEMHLTINNGDINIRSGNDGINTNEDNISVTTVNGGNLAITVTGETGEGDGIDSNGYLVINGGTVLAQACSTSGDAGIDSDKGIYINGGTVIATGHMLDRIESGGQTHAVFNFAQKQQDGSEISLKNKTGTALLEITPENAYSILIYSSPDLKEGDYTLYSGNTQLAGSASAMGGGMRPGGTPPEGFQKPEDLPEDFKPPEGMTPPEGDFHQRPDMPQGGQQPQEGTLTLSEIFKIVKGTNMFSGIAPKQ